MPSHVALLRGINVGGRNRVAMGDLRNVVAGLGHGDVSTYIQSGNVLFTSDLSDAGELARGIELAVAEGLAVEPSVVVLERRALADAIAANPFKEPFDPKRLHAVFHAEELGAEREAAIADAQGRAAAKGSPDEARVVGRTLYLNTPEGIGRSDLASRLTRPGGPAAAGTARNWATVAKLLELLDG